MFVPFIWESSESRSIMHAVNLRLRKTYVAGVLHRSQLHVLEVDG